MANEIHPRAYPTSDLLPSHALAVRDSELLGREATVELRDDPPLPGGVWLVIEGGAWAGPSAKFLLLPGDEIVLGGGPLPRLGGRAGVPSSAVDASREVACGIGFRRIADPTVSATHCRVIHTGRSIEVIDLGSRNGVRVGGVRVPRACLAIGTLFEIGRTAVRVERRGAACEVAAPPLAGLVGNSDVMCVLAGSVRRIAGLRLPALLRGESGTGKDLVARALHDESQRAGKPFVAINAATISRELAESELFGHARGAFTGAVKDRRGAFREADGGTLFLDEIGALSLEVQAKLLRAVEDGMVRPLGSEASHKVDVRLVVATCDPLEAMVADRRFRADLYERLAVCVIQVPPLRERADDIPALARHLLTTSEIGCEHFTRGAMAALRGHRWPGNVRELRNVVVQAAVRAGGTIDAEHIAEVLAQRFVQRRRILPDDALRIFEETGRNVSAAARRAELPRTTMRDLLRAAGVEAWPRG